MIPIYSGRFLVLSVLEKMSEGVMQEDKKRLKEFLKTKKVKVDITRAERSKSML